MFQVSPRRAKFILKSIRQPIADFITELDLLLQNGCLQFESEFSKPVSEICGGRPFWGDNGARMCFECVFRHYGLTLPPLSGESGLDIETIISRYQSLLRAYPFLDNRLREILAGGCENVAVDEVASVFQTILGRDFLTLTYSAIEKYGETDETRAVMLPEYQYLESAKQVFPIDYQTIEFVFIHELGHVFHNRLQEIVYIGDQRRTIQLKIGPNEFREVVLPSDMDGAVRDYLEAVGGYYTNDRDYQPPERYLGYSQALTSLNYNGTDQHLPNVYSEDGKTLLADIRRQLESQNIIIHTDKDGQQYFYLDRQAGPVNTPEVMFIEAETYIANVRDDLNATLAAIGEARNHWC